MELFVFGPLVRQWQRHQHDFQQNQEKLKEKFHDGLGQQLTAISLYAKLLADRLKNRSAEEAGDALKLSLLSDQALQETSRLMRASLVSSEPEVKGEL